MCVHAHMCVRLHTYMLGEGSLCVHTHASLDVVRMRADKHLHRTLGREDQIEMGGDRKPCAAPPLEGVIIIITMIIVIKMITLA